MSRVLSDFLGVNEPLLAESLKRLELASGHPSADIRMTTEIAMTVRAKTRELGLDPADSTGRELYHALLGLVRLHDEFLVRRLGRTADSSSSELMPLIRKAALESKVHRGVWALKHSAAKKLLKDCPPRKVMKYLNYKSLDSMLKREPVAELFAGLQLIETREWYESFVGKYKNLAQMDFETRQIEVVLLDEKKWGKAATGFVARQRHIISHVRELGAVLMLPAPIGTLPGFTITVLTQLLHHINEVRLYSTFYKLHQMRPDLGTTIAKSLLHDEGNHLYLAGEKVHWRVVQRHFGKQDVRNHPEILEPHVQPDDLSWRRAEEDLFRLEPALHFWHGTDYVADRGQDGPISFNLMDVALSYLNNLPYEQRLVSHFRESLWNELYMRYMGQPALEAQAIKQLDYEASATELIAAASRSKR